jgi:hypothetical protein
LRFLLLLDNDDCESGFVLAGSGIGYGAVNAITAMEGRNWRAAGLVRRGWQMVDLIEADDADTAFEIHALQGIAAEGKTLSPPGTDPYHRGVSRNRPRNAEATPARSALCRFKGVEFDAGCGG